MHGGISRAAYWDCRVVAPRNAVVQPRNLLKRPWCEDWIQIGTDAAIFVLNAKRKLRERGSGQITRADAIAQFPFLTIRCLRRCGSRFSRSHPCLDHDFNLPIALAITIAKCADLDSVGRN